MRNLWLVAKHEYRHMVARRSFIIITIAVPLSIAALIGLGILIAESGKSRLPLGYVDKAGILDASRQGSLPSTSDRVEIWAFADQETAMAALERGETQAFFVLPVDYQQTLHSDLYYLEEPPSEEVWGQFDDFIRLNLTAQWPEDVQHRLVEGASITVQDIVNHREFSQNTMVNVVLPFVASFVFLFATVSASGYMTQVVADEKGNRTIEMMVTSVTPGQLIGGKALGLMAAILTQLLVNAVVIVLALILATPHVEFLQALVVPWTYLGVMALFFLPAFALIAALMASIGVAVTDLQQGQQIAGLLNLLFMFPLFMLMIMFENPSHPVVLFMTYFPTSAFLTISLRWGLSTVPALQLVVSWVILTGSAFLMVWVASRVFRAGMLCYGQPLTLRSALAAIMGNGGR